MSDTQKHTKPNVPNLSVKREQKELQIHSAKRETNVGRNVPNLRFPGFEGEWKKCTLGQLGDIKGGGTPDTSTSKYWNGGIQWFTPSEIGKTKYVYKSERTISNEGLNNSSAKLLPPKSILLSSRATVGECSINLEKCCTNQGFQSFVPNTLVEGEFLYYRLLTHKKELIRKACGSTFLEISAKQIGSISSSIPEKKEQEKILSFLSLIDERIAIQNKVIERYESLIRAIYYKAFSSVIGTMINLGNLVQIKKGTQLNGENLLKIGRYYVMNGGITPSGFYNSYNTPGEVISISEGGNSCGYVQYNSSPFWSGGHCYSLLPKSQYKDVVKYRYLYHCLKYHQNDIMAMRIGSGLPNIQKKDLERFQIILPEPQDQERYTTLFDAVDSILALEKDLLNKLLKKKTYLISQMFI